jgi:dCMP deaminase
LKNGEKIMSRPTKDVYFMRIAKQVASRSECHRRSVGAVIVDGRGRILSTGTNGVAPGQTPCTQEKCPGAECPSGTGLELCEASHAEISALVTLEKPFEADTIYCTTAPCISCTKALLLTSIRRIVFTDDYPSSGMRLWLKDKREWQYMNPSKLTEDESNEISIQIVRQPIDIRLENKRKRREGLDNN